MSDVDPLAAWRANPFFVLELKLDATRADIERAGQRLLAKFGIESTDVARYPTPFGEAVRDADMVRQALAALRDPAQRVVHELWANLPPGSLVPPMSLLRVGADRREWARLGRGLMGEGR